MSDYRNLAVWQKAHQLALSSYQAMSNFPKEEIYGLTSQIRRSASSIPANIAEGTGRGSNQELIRFQRISYGSANELEYHFLLAHDHGFIKAETYQQLCTAIVEIRRMLNGLIAISQKS